MSDMTKEEAREAIADKIKLAEELIKEAEKIADATGEVFHWEIAYGMGGTYVPENAEDWDSSESGWMSSSEMC